MKREQFGGINLLLSLKIEANAETNRPQILQKTNSVSVIEYQKLMMTCTVVLGLCIIIKQSIYLLYKNYISDFVHKRFCHLIYSFFHADVVGYLASCKPSLIVS